MIHCICQGVTGCNFNIKIVFLSLTIVFVLANTVDLDAVFHLGLHSCADPESIVRAGPIKLFLSLTIVFVLANTVDLNVVFHLGLDSRNFDVFFVF